VYTGGDTLRVVSSAGALVQTIDVGGQIASAFAIDSDGTLLFGTETGKCTYAECQRWLVAVEVPDRDGPAILQGTHLKFTHRNPGQQSGL
jgi:hypothetical protein